MSTFGMLRNVTPWNDPEKRFTPMYNPFLSTPNVGKSQNCPVDCARTTAFQVPVGSLVSLRAMRMLLFVLWPVNATANHRPLSGSNSTRGSPDGFPLPEVGRDNPPLPFQKPASLMIAAAVEPS